MRRKLLKFQRFITLSLLTNFLVAANVLGGQETNATMPEYCVQGTIRTKTLIGSKGGGVSYPESTVGFEIFVADRRWLMTLGSSDLTLRDSTTVSCDGEDTYMLLNYETRIKIRAQQKLSKVSNIGDATVRNGTVPCFRFAPESGALWLAYASGPTLANSQSGVLLTVPFADYVYNVSEKAEWTTNEIMPYLPRNVHYITASDQSPNQSNTILTNVIYRTKSFMDVDGLSVPREASVLIQTYEPKQTNGAILRLCNEFHIVATNVAIGRTPTAFTPALPAGKTIVNEQRFNNENGVEFAYFIETNWPSRATLLASQGYREAVRTSIPPAPNRAIRALVLILVLLPVAFWLGSRYWKGPRPVGK